MKTISRNIKYSILSFLAVLLVIVFFTSSSPIHYQILNSVTTADTVKLEYYLELKGNVRQSKSIDEKEEIKPIDSALIEVYFKDAVFSQVFTNKKGRCIFRLPLDKNFKIVVSKRGFTTKFFEVNCNVPVGKKNTFSFSFDIDLFEEVKGLDVSILQKPIAKVAYNLIVEQFAYDIKYTSRINLDLKKMYKSYYVFLKNQADTTANSTVPLIEQKK